jgi:4-hydroxybenzoate polyprenyltransferase
VVNDLADARIDAVNLPGDARRVLAGGRVHRGQLRVAAAVALLATAAAAASMGAVSLLVAATGVVVATAYSVGPVRLAERGAVASLTLPALYVAVPYLLGLLAARGEVRARDLPFLGALYVGFIGRILLKDFRDIRGDTLFGKRTFLVRHGRVVTCRVSAACWVLASVLALLLSPHRTPTTVAGTLLATLAALHLLRVLAADPGHRREEWVVSALAIVGRGTVAVLLVPLAAAAAGGAPVQADLVAAGVVVLALGQAAQMVRHGPSRGSGSTAAGVGARLERSALRANTGGFGDCADGGPR